MAYQEEKVLQAADTLVVQEARLRKAGVVKSGEGVIRVGEVLALDNATGQLVKHSKGSTVPFTVNLEREVDATLEDKEVFVANRGAVLDMALVHIDADDYKGKHELYLADIDLMEVS